MNTPPMKYVTSHHDALQGLSNNSKAVDYAKVKLQKVEPYNCFEANLECLIIVLLRRYMH